MHDIRHRVEMRAPQARVFEAIATAQGICQWWTRDGARGESAEGARLSFHFDGGPEPAAVVVITELSPDRRVGWRCVDGPDAWVGTLLSFDIGPADDGSVVLFAHADWAEPSDFMAHCSARWAYFLLSLKAYVETGTGTPVPDDLRF